MRIPLVSRARAQIRPPEALPANGVPLLTVCAVAVTFALLFVPKTLNAPLFIALASVVAVAIIAVSLLSSRQPRLARLGVAFGYLLMIALLREAEGGASSGLAGLFLVSVTFLALSGRHRDLVAGLVVMLIAELVPIIVWGAPEYPSSGYRAVVVLMTAAAIVGFTVQQLLSDLSKGVERDVLRRVVEAQEVERRRLARELHDETGQTLTSMLVDLKRLDESPGGADHELAASLRASVVDTLRGLRRIVVELRPKALDDLGLVPALESLAATVASRTDLQVEFEAGEFPRLPADSETALYRIVQEALTNVVRHSGARTAYVFLESSGDRARLVVRDDGDGFDAPYTGREGFGLAGIRERAQLLGGRVEVTSAIGRGTSLMVEVPAS